MKLPKWMRDEFEKNVCPYCKEMLQEKNVKSHGIREERSKTKKKLRIVHFYDYKCTKCKNTCTFSFPTTFREFIQDMMELASYVMPPQLTDGTEPEMDDSFPEPEPRKSGITDEEVAEAKKVLDECEDLKDFFGKLGIPMHRDDKDKEKHEDK